MVLASGEQRRTQPDRYGASDRLAPTTGEADRDRVHEHRTSMRNACVGYVVARLMRRRQQLTWREAARRVANVTLVLWAAVAAVGVLLVVSVIR